MKDTEMSSNVLPQLISLTAQSTSHVPDFDNEKDGMETALYSL